MTTCADCKFAGSAKNFEEHDCRRRFPVAERVQSCVDTRLWVPRWPVVRSADWCGEFAPAPAKSTPPG